jgi:hypothetical protein
MIDTILYFPTSKISLDLSIDLYLIYQYLPHRNENHLLKYIRRMIVDEYTNNIRGGNGWKIINRQNFDEKMANFFEKRFLEKMIGNIR